VTEPSTSAAGGGGAEEQATESADRSAATTGPRVSRAPRLTGLVALSCYGLLPVAGVLGWAVTALIVIVISQGIDVLIVANVDLRSALARGQFGIAVRTLARELAIVVLVMSAGWTSRDNVRVCTALLLAVVGVRILYQLLMVLVRRRAVLPVETRNIDLSGIHGPPSLPIVMQRRLSERFHGLSMVALLGATIAVIANRPAVSDVVVGAVVAVELIGIIAAVVWLARSRGASIRQDYLSAVHQRVVELGSQVMIYHTGTDDSTHQINMWLPVVEQLGRPALVAMRERGCFAELDPTSLPVICIPGSVEFMSFLLPDVRVAMYTANVGKTIHMLREPGVRHVFIGHGDSDKTASFNPFSKVYSEIWVAGEGGRDRYRRAAVGIRDEDVVEVGRPQLGGIRVVTEGVGDGVLTALYAPTWEGWTGDPAHTSLLRTGPALVERLVGFPNVRVIYKPHPFTGTVSAQAAEADAAIRAIVARAGEGNHTVVGPSPTLYDCFNDADLMIADISSVLTDFIYSEKPYVVANLTGLSEDAFRELYPSVGTAYLLDPDSERIGAILDLVRDSDPLAADRRVLKHYLLGPDEPDAMTRFAAAVDAAYNRAVEELPVRIAAGAE
jgi:CDP-Glycerol:Poly(glycerophosphate) glycerophosphotransferase